MAHCICAVEAGEVAAVERQPCDAIAVSLDGHMLAALIDTGAQLTTLDADAAAAVGVTGTALARDPVTTLRGAAAEVVNSRAHRFTELQIDGERLRDQTIMVARLGLQDGSGSGCPTARTGSFWSGTGDGPAPQITNNRTVILCPASKSAHCAEWFRSTRCVPRALLHATGTTTG